MARKNTPTQVLRNRGSWRAKNRDGEVEGQHFTEPCPEWMTDRAKAKWFDLIPRLVGSNILTDLDGDVVSRYCSWWDSYLTVLETNPSCYTDLSRCEAALHKLGSKLGLSPSDRVGLKSNKPDKDAKDDKSYSFKLG